jgi:hypothetical protein
VTEAAPQKRQKVSGGISKEEMAEIIHHSDKKISPAAGFYMRTYFIMPDEITPTGPKGYITKTDVLDFVDKNKAELEARKSG